MRGLMVALGRMLRGIARHHGIPVTFPPLARSWLAECGFELVEVRIAAALASLWSREAGSLADNLTRGDKRFAWTGGDLCEWLSVLVRRLMADAFAEANANPLWGAPPDSSWGRDTIH